MKPRGIPRLICTRCGASGPMTDNDMVEIEAEIGPECPFCGAKMESESNPMRAMAQLLGRMKTPAKAKAARENGKLGGRPRKKSTAKSKDRKR